MAETTSYLLGKLEFQAARDFIDAIEATVGSLEELPLRGHTPRELKDFPDKSIREVPVFNHRMIFRVMARDVFVLFVAHSKREIEQELITRAMRFGPLGIP